MNAMSARGPEGAEPHGHNRRNLEITRKQKGMDFNRKKRRMPFLAVEIVRCAASANRFFNRSEEMTETDDLASRNQQSPTWQ